MLNTPKDLSRLPKNYIEYYEKFILPSVTTYEAKRRQALKYAILMLGIMSLIGLPVVIIIVYYMQHLDSFFDVDKWNMHIVFWSGLIMLGAVMAPIWTYSSDVMKTIYPQVFKYFGNDYSFSEKSDLPNAILLNSGMMPEDADVKTENHVKGSFNDVGIEIVDTYIEVGTRRSKFPYFKGVCILLTMNKDFNGKTMVNRDGGIIKNSIIRAIMSAFGAYSRVRLEDPVFEKMFEIYATNQIEARYLLTTSFMERLLSLGEIYHGKVTASFYHRRLLLMIERRKGWFDKPGIFKKVTFIDESCSILSQMEEIHKIINLLKLTERTGV